MTRSSYAERIADANALGLFPAGEVTTVHVEHGFGCKAPSNHPCTCFPTITAIVGDDVLTLGTHGIVLKQERRS